MKTEIIEVRDFSCNRYRENKLFHSIAKEIKWREIEKERRKRDKELFDLTIEIATLT